MTDRSYVQCHLVVKPSTSMTRYFKLESNSFNLIASATSFMEGYNLVEEIGDNFAKKMQKDKQVEDDADEEDRPMWVKSASCLHHRTISTTACPTTTPDTQDRPTTTSSSNSGTTLPHPFPCTNPTQYQCRP